MLLGAGDQESNQPQKRNRQNQPEKGRVTQDSPTSPFILRKYTHKCTQNMEWIEKEASKCLKVKESWSEIRKSSVARCLRRPPSRTATRARLRNFVLDENLVQELLMIVEFGWCKIIQIKV